MSDTQAGDVEPTPTTAAAQARSRPVDPRTQATRAKLMDACLTVIRGQGLAKLSARTLAAEADVNQALIFYHFESVSGLVRAAFLDATTRRVAALEPQLAQVTTFAELIDAAGQLHVAEEEQGNVTVLAQVLAGAQSDPDLAAAAGDALTLWQRPIRAAVERVVTDSALAGTLDADTLTRMVSASFVGMELMARTDPDLDPPALLRRLAPLAATLDRLGPLTRRAIRAGLRTRRTRGSTTSTT